MGPNQQCMTCTFILSLRDACPKIAHIGVTETYSHASHYTLPVQHAWRPKMPGKLAWMLYAISLSILPNSAIEFSWLQASCTCRWISDTHLRIHFSDSTGLNCPVLSTSKSFSKSMQGRLSDVQAYAKFKIYRTHQRPEPGGHSIRILFGLFRLCSLPIGPLIILTHLQAKSDASSCGNCICATDLEHTDCQCSQAHSIRRCTCGSNGQALS